MIKPLILLAGLFVSLYAFPDSGGTDSFIEGDTELTLDWERGYLIDGGDVRWRFYRCDDESSFNCLIVKAHAIEVSYPKGAKIGDSWVFDGREFEYVMDLDDGGWLLQSRYTEEQVESKGAGLLSSYGLVKLKEDRVYEIVTHFYFKGGREIKRHWRSRNDEGVSLLSAAPVKQRLIIPEEKVLECSRNVNGTCLKK